MSEEEFSREVEPILRNLAPNASDAAIKDALTNILQVSWKMAGDAAGYALEDTAYRG